VDQGPKVHADQPEVGFGLGLLAIRVAVMFSLVIQMFIYTITY